MNTRGRHQSPELGTQYVFRGRSTANEVVENASTRMILLFHMLRAAEERSDGVKRTRRVTRVNLDQAGMKQVKQESTH